MIGALTLAAEKSDNFTTASYLSFMEEVKLRIDEVNFRLELIEEDKSKKTRHFEVEFSYLQMRFICELIAFASLVAHHSLGLSKDLLKAYNADTIFSKLALVNPYCFPTPKVATKNAEGALHFEPRPGTAMTRENLKEVYTRCGEALHRGVLKHALQGKVKVLEPGRISFWLREIIALLECHMILVPQENRVLIVTIAGGPKGEVSIIEAVSDGPFVVGG